jgi:hypothetical protein
MNFKKLLLSRNLSIDFNLKNAREIEKGKRIICDSYLKGETSIFTKKRENYNFFFFPKIENPRTCYHSNRPVFEANR